MTSAYDPLPENDPDMPTRPPKERETVYASKHHNLVLGVLLVFTFIAFMACTAMFSYMSGYTAGVVDTQMDLDDNGKLDNSLGLNHYALPKPAR